MVRVRRAPRAPFLRTRELRQRQDKQINLLRSGCAVRMDCKCLERLTEPRYIAPIVGTARAAIRRAVAFPIPLLAPVTSTTFDDRSAVLAVVCCVPAARVESSAKCRRFSPVGSHH